VSDTIYQQLVKSTLELQQSLFRILPTPTKYLSFNFRHSLQIILGMLDIDPSYLTSDPSYCKLWIHESTRVYFDRFTDLIDRKLFKKTVKECIYLNFEIEKQHQVKSIDGLYFGLFNPKNDGKYTEVQDIQRTMNNLQPYLTDYNNESVAHPLDLIVF